MNILFIYGNGVLPHIGGIANITLSLAEMFRNEGHQVWYLGLLKCETCSYDENQLFFPTCEDGKENFDYLFNICKNKQINIVINQIPLYDARIVHYLNKIRKECDLIVFSCLHTPITSQVENLYFRKEYKLLKNNKKIFLWRLSFQFVIDFIFFFYKRKYKQRYLSIINESDETIVLCKGMMNQLIKMTDVSDTSKIKIIPNFVQDKKTGNMQKENIIIWCGLIDFDIKRIDAALKIWKECMDKLPDWSFHILGDGIGLKEAKSLARKLKLRNIVFEGRIDPIPFYCKAKIVTVTSSFESFSLVTLEAQKYGCVPIVYNTFPAASMLIKDGQTGFLIAPYETKSFANKILKVALETDIFEVMSQMAIESSKKYSPDVIFYKWKKLLSQKKYESFRRK